MRIVSLIASATEMVAALGLADQLVGISHECDYPPEAVRGRPVLTSPKMDVKKKSLDIHRDVEAIVSLGLSVYKIDVEKLKSAAPDIILTQDQCEVCAVTYDDVVKASKECLDTNALIVTLHPDSLEDIYNDFGKVAEALQVEEKGRQCIKDLRQGMNSIHSKTKTILKKPRVVCLEWLSPLMAAGNWIPEMVDMAGGMNGFTKRGDHTKVITWKELQSYDPDVLVLMPCGFTIAQSLENRLDLESLPGFKDLKAVRGRQVFVVDGNTYMNRPGPRILESLYILAGIFHPELFEKLIPKGALARWA
ncbi:MAG: cobalamin-binding protein [Deltaproteobacteria bacterium]|nr:cobalamin-binding protein [Deltaproteobacteria bacterium]